MREERILSIGKDVGLLLLRSEVILSGGYRVIATTDFGTAVEIIHKMRVSLILICHSMPRHHVHVVRERAKRTGGIPVLQMAAAAGADLPPRRGEVAASPTALLKGIDSSLHHRNSRSA